MTSWLRDRLTLANVLSTGCLVLLLGGGVATALPGKSRVNSGDIRDGQVKGIDVLDGQIRGRDIADGAIEPSVQRRLPAARIAAPRESCAPQLIASGVPEALRFAVEEFDPGGIHPDPPGCTDPSTRMFAPRAGVYHLGAAVHWPADPNGIRELSLRIDDSKVAASETRLALPSGETLQTIATTRRLAFDDRVETVVEQTSGSSLELAGGVDNNYMTMIWVGP